MENKTVCEKNRCTGCNACIQICPKGAIMLQDDCQTLNAVIDEKKCIHCNACVRACQVIQKPELQRSVEWFQGWTANNVNRELSSSGGFAYEIAKQWIADGGFVCSCIFSEGKFQYQIIKQKSELEKIRGSKYVKSELGNIYREIRTLLPHKKVLFIGLPCHVGGLLTYLGKYKTENLVTIDLICHGTPSVKLLSLFLKQSNISINSLQNIHFRKKNKYRVVCYKRIDFAKNNRISFTPEDVRDRYTMAFLNGLNHTENCYSCRYAGNKRISDITIGDSWGSELKEEEQAKGISLALCQTEKGSLLLKRTSLHLEAVDLNKAITANHQLSHPSKMPKERKLFFDSLKQGIKFDKAVAKCYPKACFRADVKTFLIKWHLWGFVKKVMGIKS